MILLVHNMFNNLPTLYLIDRTCPDYLKVLQLDECIINVNCDQYPVEAVDWLAEFPGESEGIKPLPSGAIDVDVPIQFIVNCGFAG